MWTHVTRHLKDIQVAIFPRLLAVAEQGWAVRERRNYNDFSQRLQGQFKRLDNLGISYWKPPQK
jgi:hexosaminidase